MHTDIYVLLSENIEEVEKEMLHKIEILDIQDIKRKVRAGDVLLFDMDGTLIHTNVANNIAYKRAIQYVLGQRYDALFADIGRIEREHVKERLNWVSDEGIIAIILKKKSII